MSPLYYLAELVRLKTYFERFLIKKFVGQRIASCRQDYPVATLVGVQPNFFNITSNTGLFPSNVLDALPLKDIF